MRFDIITPFSEAFSSYLGISILKRAIERRLVSVRFTDPRKFSEDRHRTIAHRQAQGNREPRRTIDGKPYGGGAGMVLMAEPILKATIAALRRIKNQESGIRKTAVVLLSAKGRQFDQKMAYEWARRYKRLVLISGRYEGIDERVKTVLHDSRFMLHEISIGPYVLTDGDAAAMVIISAVSRLIPGVIRLESLQEESHWNRRLKGEAHSRNSGQAGKDAKGLEYPHYTRPEAIRWKGKAYRVPKVLLSGDHRRIAEWRSRKSR